MCCPAVAQPAAPHPHPLPLSPSCTPPSLLATPQVKTQRALNDYRKSEFPHYKDELTRLRYIGAITATRLKDVRATVNPGVPMTSVTNVQELKGLLEYAESDR